METCKNLAAQINNIYFIKPELYVPIYMKSSLEQKNLDGIYINIYIFFFGTLGKLELISKRRASEERRVIEVCDFFSEFNMVFRVDD